MPWSFTIRLPPGSLAEEVESSAALNAFQIAAVRRRRARGGSVGPRYGRAITIAFGDGRLRRHVREHAQTQLEIGRIRGRRFRRLERHLATLHELREVLVERLRSVRLTPLG